MLRKQVFVSCPASGGFLHTRNSFSTIFERHWRVVTDLYNPIRLRYMPAQIYPTKPCLPTGRFNEVGGLGSQECIVGQV